MMIASLVGLILMAGTMQMFSSTKQSSRTSTAITRMQENGRAGLYFIENAVRLAGYRPDSVALSFDEAFQDGSFDFDGQVIKGFDNDNDANASNILRDSNNNNILDGSDRILIRYRGNNDGFISDCSGASPGAADTTEVAFRIRHIKDIDDDNINRDDSDKDIGELVCDPDLGNANDEQVLIDGVEDMQIVYGIDTNSDFTADFYTEADHIPANKEVVSVRISLLLRSDDLIATQAQSYRFNNITVSDPGDRRLRKVFSTTTAVRNLVD